MHATVTAMGLTATVDVTGNTGTDAGDYTLTATGNGNFTGSVSKAWSIAKLSIVSGTVTLEDELTYNGQVQTMHATVTVGELTATVALTGNTGTDAKDYRLFAEGSGNYVGSVSQLWSIAKKTLTEEMVSVPKTSYVYNGAYQTIGCTVSDGTAMTAADYTVTGLTYRYVGEYEVVVTATHNYEGSVTVPWEITQKPLAESMITISGTMTYNGALQMVSFTVFDGAEGSILATDYTVSGNSGTNAGDYALTITATQDGNYSGSASKAWTIEQLSISKAVVTLGDALIYNGAQQTMHATVTAMGLTATVNLTGNTGTDAGDYTLTATGTGNFKDSVSKDWSIGRLSIVAGTVTLEDELTYNGSEQTMHASVSVDDLAATTNLAATVTLSGNTGTDAGGYVLTATGTGNFTGSVSKSWAIAKKTLTEEMVSTPETSFVYDGTLRTIGCTVSDGTAMTSADYTISGNVYKNVGSYTLTVTAGHNYTGIVTRDWAITQKALTADMITINGSLTYDGAQQTVSYTISDGAEGTIMASDFIASGYNGTDAGTYTLKIEAKPTGNYSGSATKDWTIERLSISKAVVTLGDALTYNGQEQTMHVVVITMGLTATVDVTGNTGTDAGNYTLTATGTGNFKDSVEKGWSIAKLSVITGTVTFGKTLTYNGSEQTMPVTVTVNGLTATVDVTGNTGTDAGDYDMTATGNGNFTGSISKMWTIGRLSIDNATVTLDDTLTYNGHSQIMPVTVTVDGHTATVDVVGNEKTNAGDYTLTATGTGNFTGSVSKNWNLGRLSVADADVRLIDQFTYNGETQVMSVIVTVDELNATVELSDNSGVDAGAYTLTATGVGNFTGTVTKDWAIAQKALADYMVIVSGAYTYNGADQNVDYKVIDGSEEVNRITPDDYTVTGQTGKDHGVYDLVVTAAATGNYTGTARTTWSIAQKSLENSMVSTSGTYTYNGTAQTVEYAVADETFLVPADYTVSGQTHTDYGTYELVITATATGNYTGIAKTSWSIEKLSVENATIVLGDPLTYNGQLQTMTVTVDVGDLPATVDVLGNNHTDAGDYTLTITGYGNFKGTVTRDWSIAKLSVATGTVTLDDELTYNGKTQTMPATVTVNGLTATVTLSDNKQIAAGDYSLTATGTGNFTGTIGKDWSISRLSIEHAVVIYDNDLIYTGEELTRTATVMVNGLVADVTYSGNTGTDAGDYTMTITGVGNYVDSIDKAWSIIKKEFKASFVTVENDRLPYTGYEQMLKYTVTDGEPSAITADDYTVNSGDRATEIGDYSLVLMATDAGNYTGNVIVNWSIIPGMVTVTLDTAEGVFAAVGWDHIVGNIYSKQFGNNVLWGEVIDDIGTVERYGYTFTGYLPEVDVEAEVGLGGGSLTAQWSINDYTVTVTQPAFGVISVDGYTLVDDKVTVPYLTELTFSYTGAEGYYLTSWIGADDDGNLTVIADCVLACTLGHTYAVIFDARGVITETQQEYGQPVQLISRPDNVDVEGTHYIFCGWDGYVEGMLVDGEMRFTAWYSVVYSDTTKTATIVREGVLELDETSIEDILNSDDEYIRIYGSDANVLMKMSTFANMTTEGKFTLVLDKTEDTLTPEQKKAIGNSYSIMVEAWNGDVQVHQIGADVLVTIPFELKNGVTADRLMVYYVDDHGRMEKYDSTYYDYDLKAVCFYTNHFSTFMVCTDYGVITMAQIAFVFTFVFLVICFAYLCHRHYRGKRARMESETSQ